MNRLLLSGIQIAVSMWEIRLCYKMLYIMASDEKYSTRTDKVIMWCVILLVGGALGVNRLNFFFSNLLFFLVNIIVILCVCARKRKILLNAGVIILYFAINVNNLTQSTTTYSVSFNWHGIPCAFLYL